MKTLIAQAMLLQTREQILPWSTEGALQSHPRNGANGLLAIVQDGEAIDIVDTPVAGAGAELVLYLLNEAPATDRHGLAPMLLPFQMAAPKAGLDPLVLHDPKRPPATPISSLRASRLMIKYRSRGLWLSGRSGKSGDFLSPFGD